jgi:hypothetical protein
MTEPMSADAFKWFITFLTGGLASVWVVYDSFNLTRLLRSTNVDRTDGVYRDRRFGYAMGIVIGVVGIIGCLMFHGVL